jgi:hypothetical protein
MPNRDRPDPFYVGFFPDARLLLAGSAYRIIGTSNPIARPIILTGSAAMVVGAIDMGAKSIGFDTADLLNLFRAQIDMITTNNDFESNFRAAIGLLGAGLGGAAFLRSLFPLHRHSMPEEHTLRHQFGSLKRHIGSIGRVTLRQLGKLKR